MVTIFIPFVLFSLLEELRLMGVPGPPGEELSFWLGFVGLMCCERSDWTQ